MTTTIGELITIDRLIESLNTMHRLGEVAGERHDAIESELVNRFNSMPFDDAMKILSMIDK